MVTHEPQVPAIADRILLRADGRLAGELRHPSASAIMQAIDQASRP